MKFNTSNRVAADSRSELFITAVTTFVENNFYEDVESLKSRLMELAAEVAVNDYDWFVQFVRWLRAEGNMRSASILVAVAGTSALRDNNIPGGRAVIDAAIQRADEPAEIVAAWRSMVGRNIPTVVRKGINDAINRVWTEYSVAKYNSGAYSMRDVLNLCHPNMKNQALGEYIIATAYGREPDLSELPMLAARKRFLSLDDAGRRQAILSGEAAQAGITWEVASSTTKPDAQMWEALLPSMGYMARLRSLRRLEEAGVDEGVLEDLGRWLADGDNVVKSRQLPLRFLSAYRQSSLRFHWPLEQAVNHSLGNIEKLKGSTLVLVDRSGSMGATLSKHSSLSREDAANVFGAAIARRSESATFVDFASTNVEVDFTRFSSVLAMANRPNTVGYATMAATAVREHYCGQDRVIILTDDQSQDGDPGRFVPASVPLYIWNLSGYARGATTPGTNRYVFGGLSDASFNTIGLVESGHSQKWPWLIGGRRRLG